MMPPSGKRGVHCSAESSLYRVQLSNSSATSFRSTFHVPPVHDSSSDDWMRVGMHKLTIFVGRTIDGVQHGSHGKLQDDIGSQSEDGKNYKCVLHNTFESHLHFQRGGVVRRGTFGRKTWSCLTETCSAEGETHGQKWNSRSRYIFISMTAHPCF